MGKRLTPEEREARIKAYEEAKAARQAARLEKRKARVEAYEKRKEIRKKGVKPAEVSESSKNGQVKAFPSYPGEVEVGDELGFRFLGLAMTGKLVNISKERNYRIRESDEAGEEVEEITPGRETYIVMYSIKASDGTFYPIRKNDILAKKINNIWIDKFNYSKVNVSIK